MVARTLAISATLVAAVSALTVNTPPALVQCQPAQLSWADGTAPYFLAVIPGGQPSAAALENLPQQTGLTYTWTVDQAAGTSVTIKVTDSTGTINYSDQVTIQAGTETTCSSAGGAGAGSSVAGAGSSVVASASSIAVAASSSASSVIASVSSAAKSVASSVSSVVAVDTKAATASSASSSSSSSSSSASKASSSSSSDATSTSAIGAAAAATSTSSKSGAASHVKAGLGMLVGGIVLALAA